MSTIRRVYRRVCDLGAIGVWRRVSCRMQKKLFAWRWKKRALAHKAHHTWDTLEPFFKTIMQTTITLPPDLPRIPLTKSSFFTQSCTTSNCCNKFYQEIIPSDTTPDIKISWEQARFQHIVYDKSYAKKFEAQMLTWTQTNRFMIGVNWVCPMEVAIRAINWIFAFQFFKKDLSETFTKTLICSLYDHAYYLAHNFETSDRPNNHYLADLVGYFYLTLFFDAVPKFKKARKRTFKKILAQFEHQVHPDGTSYEGSTSYHKLVTELFLLFTHACDTHACASKSITLPTHFKKKLNKMVKFLEHSSVGGRLVQIGDNDSGTIVGLPTHGAPTHGAPTHTIAPSGDMGTHSWGTHHYKDFGLTIIKTKKLHLTFRHPTYQSHQPTGHFHHDELAVTLAVNSIPVLVDPGSYVYTANRAWRNKFRSYNTHNTFYPKKEKIDETIDLFQLPKRTHKETAVITHEGNITSIQNKFKNQKRTVVCNVDRGEVSITDEIVGIPPRDNMVYEWSFLFHQDISVKHARDRNVWTIFHDKKKLLILQSSLDFVQTTGFYSPEYGEKQAVVKLIGESDSFVSSQFRIG